MRTIATAALFASLASASAMAFDCPFGKGKAITLDFETIGKNITLNLEPVTVGEQCKVGSTEYRLIGMPGVYPSSKAAFDAFKMVRALKGAGLTGDDLVAALKFVDEKEKQAEKTAQAKQ